MPENGIKNGCFTNNFSLCKCVAGFGDDRGSVPYPLAGHRNGTGHAAREIRFTCATMRRNQLWQHQYRPLRRKMGRIKRMRPLAAPRAAACMMSLGPRRRGESEGARVDTARVPVDTLRAFS